VRFRDRRHAGSCLADHVAAQAVDRPVVLALPRGGVPVAFEVARRLAVPFDVFVARKVGAPTQPEFGIGAVAEGGGCLIDEPVVARLGVRRDQLDALVERERLTVERRVHDYRGGRDLPAVAGRDVVVVDDGLATGVTARAALAELRRRRPRRLLLAVPVCARATAQELVDDGIDLVCAHAPAAFAAVGRWYDDFAQTTDEEVLDLLHVAAPGASGPGPEGPADERLPSAAERSPVSRR
jgi:putative phosphoribosyl transferase